VGNNTHKNLTLGCEPKKKET